MTTVCAGGISMMSRCGKQKTIGAKTLMRR
jgi:hypothetical protein